MIWTAHMIAFAVGLQSIEHLLINRRLRTLDPWDSDRGLDDVLAYLPTFSLVSSLVGVIYPHWFLTLALFVSTYLFSVRYRGTFNGGSDAITLHVLGALGMGQVWPELEGVAALYIAVFVCLSYFVAGMSKLLSRQWRTGEALPCFLHYSNAASSNAVTTAILKSRWTYMASWLVVIWECFFPIGLLYPSMALVFVSLGVLFHLVNYFVFGLNRFFWAWLAAYPAFLSIHRGFE